MAGPIPISARILRKCKITRAMATVPNAEADIHRDSMATTIKDTTIPEYLASAIQNTPFMTSDLILLFVVVIFNQRIIT